MIMVGIMIVFGLVMVYSASWDVSYRLFGNPSALTVRQLGNLVFGLIALCGRVRLSHSLSATAGDFRSSWGRSSSLFVLLLVSAGDGPRRAFLAGSVQPSELAKLARDHLPGRLDGIRRASGFRSGATASCR